MAHLVYTLLLVVSTEGLSEMIQTQDHVRVMVGEDARFTCQLTQPKNVVQITWNKMLSGGTETVATYNKRDGTRIIPPFQGKIEFEDAGLQRSTIVVRNVTKADASSCYRCIFNAFPEGSIHRTSCLIVYEQPEPILHITKPSGTKLMGASCSTVSHPAPTVTLEVSRHPGSLNYTTSHTANTNGTVTVTSTVTMEMFCSNSIQVRCVVRFYSGIVKEASRVISSDEQDLCCDVLEESEADQNSSTILVICAAAAAVIGVVIGVIIAVFRLGKKRTRSNNDPLKQTPHTTIQETKKLVSHQITIDNGLHKPVNTQPHDISRLR